jgi:hypothetical protein
MQARNYMHVQNAWSLMPGIWNKPKLPAPKFGKDGRPIFDKNRGYEGPNQITTIMWITASCNIKEALTSLQMKLEGENLQIRWKPTQKKNSRNQIVIFGLPLGFDPKGIMRELLYGLKECKKELCDANRFKPPSENIDRRDRSLPLLNGYYKQATPPKAPTHSKSLENSLNNNKEYMQNGCRLFHLEYNPAVNNRMEPVWTQFIDSGRSKSCLKLCSKIFVLLEPGQQAPDQIMLIRRFMKFHCHYTGITRIHSHSTVTNLDKVVEISMVDPATKPPRKFTTLCQEYMDLCTTKDLPIFHTVLPRVETANRRSLIDCLYLARNARAKDLPNKISICPLA